MKRICTTLPLRVLLHCWVLPHHLPLVFWKVKNSIAWECGCWHYARWLKVYSYCGHHKQRVWSCAIWCTLYLGRCIISWSRFPGKLNYTDYMLIFWVKSKLQSNSFFFSSRIARPWRNVWKRIVLHLFLVSIRSLHCSSSRCSPTLLSPSYHFPYVFNIMFIVFISSFWPYFTVALASSTLFISESETTTPKHPN